MQTVQDSQSILIRLDTPPKKTQAAPVCAEGNDRKCRRWVTMCETSEGYARQILDRHSSSVTWEALMEEWYLH